MFFLVIGGRSTVFALAAGFLLGIVTSVCFGMTGIAFRRARLAAFLFLPRFVLFSFPVPLFTFLFPFLLIFFFIFVLFEGEDDFLCQRLLTG